MPCSKQWEPERDVSTLTHPYASQAYTATLAHVGRPFRVSDWDTYVIARDYKGQAEDAVGTYPIACLATQSDLHAGLDVLRKAGFVSVTLVVDTLVGPSLDQFKDAFTLVHPFKTHYLVDGILGTYLPSKHHRYEIRRAAQRGVEIRVVSLLDVLDEWTTLYETLISHHHITGVQRFSRASFEALANCDGFCTIAAFVDQKLVSCHLWVECQNFVWSHLAASNALGYDSGAAYAVYDYSIRYFSHRLINLGGAAGVGATADDGLARFKAGFSNRTQPAYLIGSILNPEAYQNLCAERNTPTSVYFPAYRTPISVETALPFCESVKGFGASGSS
jgi:hypothetical protein